MQISDMLQLCRCGPPLNCGNSRFVLFRVGSWIVFSGHRRSFSQGFSVSLKKTVSTGNRFGTTVRERLDNNLR